MADAPQDRFELSTRLLELMRVIEQGTDAIWSQVLPVVAGQSGSV